MYLFKIHLIRVHLNCNCSCNLLFSCVFEYLNVGNHKIICILTCGTWFITLNWQCLQHTQTHTRDKKLKDHHTIIYQVKVTLNSMDDTS